MLQVVYIAGKNVNRDLELLRRVCISITKRSRTQRNDPTLVILQTLNFHSTSPFWTMVKEITDGGKEAGVKLIYPEEEFKVLPHPLRRCLRRDPISFTPEVSQNPTEIWYQQGVTV